MKRFLGSVFLFVICAIGTQVPSAQDVVKPVVDSPAKPAPELTTEQRLTLVTSLQRIENDQLKIQLLTVDAQQVQSEAERYRQTLDKDGYEVDVATLTYKLKVIK